MYETIIKPNVIYFLRNKMRIQFISIISIGLLWALSCSKEKMPTFDSDAQVAHIIQQWNNLFLDLDRNTPNYRPPLAARSFAYISLIAYETAIPALDQYRSMNGLLNGLNLTAVKSPINYNLVDALNASYAKSFRYFFSSAPIEEIDKITQLEKYFNTSSSKHASINYSDSSVIYANRLTDAIISWSSQDLRGDRADFHLYDSCYKMEDKPGIWRSPKLHPSLPILPHWGEVRPFVIDPSMIKVNPPMDYSIDKSSQMYKEAIEVYSMSQPLSEENKWISEFWSDDHHGLTFTPSTRWVSITNQVIKLTKPNIGKQLESYLKVGLALCDAGIIVWKTKYKYKRERPIEYINRVINSRWESYHDSPPFPTYPSGHSAFGASAAQVLSQLYGNEFAFTDFSHADRREFNGNPRSFNSFYDMAKENAFSRISMGVHYRNDCEEGLRIGFNVGNIISKINLLKSNEALLYNK